MCALLFAQRVHNIDLITAGLCFTFLRLISNCNSINFFYISINFFLSFFLFNRKVQRLTEGNLTKNISSQI